MEKGFWNAATEPSDGPDFSSLPEFMGPGFLLNYGECEKINVELANGILSMKPSATASERRRQLFGGMCYILSSRVGVLTWFGCIIAPIEGKSMEDVFNADGSRLPMFGIMERHRWWIVLVVEL
mgnify:CR=1 FL=1